MARPLCLQVRDALVERIAVGDWKPGVQIPNEGELAREFGVSPGTMRKALDLMEGERLVTRRQGRGAFGNDHWFDERALRLNRHRSVDAQKVSCRVAHPPVRFLRPVAFPAAAATAVGIPR
jgi:GntR family transcriptional regulator